MNGSRWHAAATEVTEWGRIHRRTEVAPTARPRWLETAKAGILYFGLTLMPLLVVILLYRDGVIG